MKKPLIKIKGTFTETKTCDITQEELLKALWKSFGLDDVYGARKHEIGYIGVCYKRTEEGLIKYHDVSYHGSVDYEPSGYKITDLAKLKAYDLLVELEKLLMNTEEQN